MAKAKPSRGAEETARDLRGVHAFDILEGKSKVDSRGLVVIYGSDRFLRREVALTLANQWLGPDAEFPLTRLAGKGAQWRDVHDQVLTPGLFGPPLGAVVLEDGDDFVKAYRAQLETFADRPRDRTVLVLDLDQWLTNTRLAKLVAEKGTVVRCAPPETNRKGQIDRDRLVRWLEKWGKEKHGAVLQPKAGTLLLDLAGLECGKLDQELAKLAVWGDGKGQVTPEVVQEAVGGWRTQTTWDMLDAACLGNTGEALRQLDRLLQSGEPEMVLFASISWTLRRFAAATRYVQEGERAGQRLRLPDILAKAGFKPWPAGALERAEAQLRQIGRRRGGRIYQRLLETDLALKGSHSQPERARAAIELLLIELSQHVRQP